MDRAGKSKQEEKEKRKYRVNDNTGKKKKPKNQSEGFPKEAKRRETRKTGIHSEHGLESLNWK